MCHEFIFGRGHVGWRICMAREMSRFSFEERRIHPEFQGQCLDARKACRRAELPLGSVGAFWLVVPAE